MAKLNIKHEVVAFQDDANASNPLQKFVDWKRAASMYLDEVGHQSQRIEAGGFVEVMPASQGGVLVADTETFTLQPHPSKEGLYQVRAVGAEMNFLGQTVAAPGASYTFAPNTDGSISLRCNDTFEQPPADLPEMWVVGGPFAALSRGDRLYVPGTPYGDTGPFAVENTGFWEVVAVGGNPGSEVRLKRVASNDHPGVAETVTVTATRDLQRVDGVSPYGKVFILASGSSLYYSGAWEVAEAARGWFSIHSDRVLPTVLQAAFERLYLARHVIGFLRVETDRLARVDYHSAAGPFEMVITPVIDGEREAMGWFEVNGFITGLTVRNLSAEAMRVNIVVGYDKSVA
jgi:hypothetical protein